jgi:hypothetical protein
MDKRDENTRDDERPDMVVAPEKYAGMADAEDCVCCEVSHAIYFQLGTPAAHGPDLHEKPM